MLFSKLSYKVSIVIVLLFSFLSCASNQKAISEEPTVNTPPKLLFLNYELSKSTNGEKKINLLNQITAEGRLKEKPTIVENTQPGDLQYFILDKDLKEIDTQYIKNPLIKTFEFINDHGEFEKKTIDLDTVQFHIRLQLQPQTKYIVFKELTENKPKTHITTKIE